MKLLEIAVKDLQHFFSSPIYNNLQAIPLTPERMLSQANNPRARADDIVLIVAITDDNKLAGFVGMLPDMAFSAETTYRFAWNSCWWVDPVYGKGVALKLFYKSIQTWEGQYMITDLTEYTRKIVKQTGLFYFTEPEKGVYLKIMSDLSLSYQGRIRKRKILLSIFNITDRLLNGFMKARLDKWKGKNDNAEITVQYIPSFNESDIEFIHKMNRYELCRREKTEFEWISAYPWLTPKTIQEWNGRSYPFSWLCRHYSLQFVRLLQNNEITGLAMLTCRDGMYKIPYAYFRPGSEKICYNAICRILIERQATGFLTFREDLAKYIKNSRFPVLKKRTVLRELAVSKSLAHYHPEQYLLQDGDGDVVFT